MDPVPDKGLRRRLFNLNSSVTTLQDAGAEVSSGISTS